MQHRWRALRSFCGNHVIEDRSEPIKSSGAYKRLSDVMAGLPFWEVLSSFFPLPLRCAKLSFQQEYTFLEKLYRSPTAIPTRPPATGRGSAL
jgi:hypothetical protein